MKLQTGTNEEDKEKTESNFLITGVLKTPDSQLAGMLSGLSSGDGTMLRNQQNMAQTLGTSAGNLAGQFRGIAVMRSGSVSSVSHSDSSGERQGYQRQTGNGLLGAEPETTPTTAEIKPTCQCSPGDPSAAIWARLIVSRALSS